MVHFCLVEFFFALQYVGISFTFGSLFRMQKDLTADWQEATLTAGSSHFWRQ